MVGCAQASPHHLTPVGSRDQSGDAHAKCMRDAFESANDQLIRVPLDPRDLRLRNAQLGYQLLLGQAGGPTGLGDPFAGQLQR